MMPTECFVYKNLSRSVEQTLSYACSMRRLRRSVLKCAECEHYDTCAVMHNFRAAIDRVIEELTVEWNLRV